MYSTFRKRYGKKFNSTSKSCGIDLFTSIVAPSFLIDFYDTVPHLKHSLGPFIYIYIYKSNP